MPPILSANEQQTRLKIVISLALVIATMAVYFPTRNYEFVDFDDSLFVTENPHLRHGLNWQSVHWAFTADLTYNDRNADYWRPLSYLSHALDIEMFGLRPAGHHLMSVGIHVATTVALFLVLLSMTGVIWRCGLVAALFALHPLHVESVAWVSERKDVLSGLFFILTIGAYARYVRRPFSASSYLVVLVGLALALLSKPMSVTLPFVLLLLDYWPLGRTRWAEPAAGAGVKVPPIRLLKEKIPLFVLAALSCVVTYRAQLVGGIVQMKLPFAMRLTNALLSYMRYLGKTFWPTKLSFFYPLEADLPITMAAGATLALFGITVAVMWQQRQRPWLLTGWFWFLGTLVPAIGLVQVGGQAMADRYTYVPLIGLFLMLCWSLPYRAIASPQSKAVIFLLSGTVIAACTSLSVIQIGYWKNSETLFRHALRVTRNNALAHNNLGATLRKADKTEEAAREFKKAVQITPDYAEAHYNLGMTLLHLNRSEEAIGCLEEALRLKPTFAEAHHDLGSILDRSGELEQAVLHYERALRIKPDYAEAHNNLGAILERLGRHRDAIRHYEQALRIKPDYIDAHYNLGVALWESGKSAEAITHWEQALRIQPDLADAHDNLADAFVQRGELQKAIGHYQQVLHLKPADAKTHNDLGAVLWRAGRLQEAVQCYERAIQITPDFAEAHYNLGGALEQQNRVPEAIAHYEQALRIKPDLTEAKNRLARLQSIQ